MFMDLCFDIRTAGPRKADRLIQHRPTADIVMFLLLLFLDVSKLQNPGRKQSVSRSLKHLFNSSNKFVKTLKRFVMRPLLRAK